jgi:3-oxoacyl-[acyl-carrier protein] reductase
MATRTRALVMGRDAGFGRELARGLAALGVELADDGPVGLVVHADLDPRALEPQAVAATSLDDWQRRCEAVLWGAFETAKRAHGLLQPAGGLLVFVTPTIGMTGAAHLVPLATAIEGVRSLARVAARQWGPAGIRVNCVAPSVEAFARVDGRLGPDVAEPALGAGRVHAGSVAALVALLADERVAVTGATVAVDGGVVMTP